MKKITFLLMCSMIITNLAQAQEIRSLIYTKYGPFADFGEYKVKNAKQKIYREDIYKKWDLQDGDYIHAIDFKTGELHSSQIGKLKTNIRVGNFSDEYYNEFYFSPVGFHLTPQPQNTDDASGNKLPKGIFIKSSSSESPFVSKKMNKLKFKKMELSSKLFEGFDYNKHITQEKDFSFKGYKLKSLSQATRSGVVIDYAVVDTTEKCNKDGSNCKKYDHTIHVYRLTLNGNVLFIQIDGLIWHDFYYTDRFFRVGDVFKDGSILIQTSTTTMNYCGEVYKVNLKNGKKDDIEKFVVSCVDMGC